jgi:hypothetical protein
MDLAVVPVYTAFKKLDRESGQACKKYIAQSGLTHAEELISMDIHDENEKYLRRRL